MGYDSLMIRLGLCCIFRDVPISFRTTTAAAMQRLQPHQALDRLSKLCLSNAASLQQAIAYCAAQGIGAFRVNSGILPVITHPRVGYRIDDLPDADAIIAAFRQCGTDAGREGIRLLFHPDQFVLLSSERASVTQSAIAELDYQAMVAGWIGADVINIHGGGAYGDKTAALNRVRENIEKLPMPVRSRLTLENDDRVYTPADLLPLCRATRVPLVYDVHHHRCLPDGMSEDAATEAALATWDREPVFHVSSPLAGWHGPKPHRHHDYIRIGDFPACWTHPDVTVEVEAKAKEKAVLRLRRSLQRRQIQVWGKCNRVLSTRKTS